MTLKDDLFCQVALVQLHALQHGNQWFSLGLGVRWDSTMGKGQAHRRPGRCHAGGPGKLSLSKGYHLLYFCCIKSPGDMLRRSDTIEGYCIHCFWNRYGSVMRMQTSHTSCCHFTVIGYPVHTCLVIIRWMVEVYQILHSPSTFQSWTVFCVHTGSCPDHPFLQLPCRNLH